MPKTANDELERLAEIIVAKFKEEFRDKHLSGNLINTLEVSVESGKIVINIPAKTYNMLLFQQKGIIVHTSHGSYAEKLDREGSSFMVYHKNTRKGSFRISPRNHIGYIDRVVNSALLEWKSSSGNKVKKIEG